MKKNIFILFVLSILLVGCGSKTDPPEDNEGAVAIAKPTVNFYVENSGSMFGYITDGNDFDKSISSLLTQLKVSEYTDSLNLFYINSRSFKQDVSINQFVKGITLRNARTWPGQLGSTDMCQLFDSISATVDENNISIMISDCIFSPGNGVPAMKFINDQKHCITRRVNGHLKNHNFDLAFVVYRMISNFRGRYYDCVDSVTNINDDRPYFIWIVGTKENIAEFNKKGIEDKIEGRLENSYTIFSSDDKASYAVQYNPKIGDFKRDTPYKISNAKPDSYAKKFLFTVSVNFSSLLLDNDYLTDPNNYLLSDSKYIVEIDMNNNSNNNFTHDIRISTESNIITKTTLSIKLINQIPGWIEQYSDDACTHINADGMMEKTYGLKHLVDGIYSAYNFKSDVLTELEIEIN